MKVNIPAAKQQGIKLAALHSSGYVIFAAVAICACRHSRLALCSQESILIIPSVFLHHDVFPSRQFYETDLFAKAFHDPSVMFGSGIGNSQSPFIQGQPLYRLGISIKTQPVTIMLSAYWTHALKSSGISSP